VKVPIQSTGTEQLVVATKSAKADGAKGLRYPLYITGQLKRKNQMDKAKQFVISQQKVRDAFFRVKKNLGQIPEIRQLVTLFAHDLDRNLYKLWNRMSSGSYFPPVTQGNVSAADLQPNQSDLSQIADHVAQMLVGSQLEDDMNSSLSKKNNPLVFQKAVDALDEAKTRCLKRDWAVVIDLSTLVYELNPDVILACLKPAETPWVSLYAKRWLDASRQSDGKISNQILQLLQRRVLISLFDPWVLDQLNAESVTRFDSNAILHLKTKAEADRVTGALKIWLLAFGMTAPTSQTVYCKDSKRPLSHEIERFDFLGYTFQQRVRGTAETGLSRIFAPAISAANAKKIRAEIRSWQLNTQSHKTLEQIAQDVNPALNRWIAHYGRHHKSALNATLEKLDDHLVKWAMRKHKRFHRRPNVAREWLAIMAQNKPELFAHWHARVK